MSRRSAVLCVFGLVLLATAVYPADTLVSLYVGARKVNCAPQARVRDGVTYAPLRAAAQAVGGHVEWNAGSRSATICVSDRCVPVRADQGIMVDNAMLIPVRLVSEALGRPVTWDAAAQAVRIK